MNEEQVKSSVRTLVSAFGGAIAGWAASKGWFSVDQVLSVLNSQVFIGIATSIGVGIWGLFVHKQSNAVAIVAAIAADPTSPVKSPILENTVDGRALMATIKKDNPDAVVAVAGTGDAAKAASSSQPMA